MTHTPTPWYATGVNDMKKTMGIYCSDCGNQMPREDLKSRVGAGMTNDALVEAYRAVNSHDALVEALKETMSALSDIINASETEPYTPEELQQNTFGKPVADAYAALEQVK